MNNLHSLEAETYPNIRTVAEAAENRKYEAQRSQNMIFYANVSTELLLSEVISSGPSVAKLAHGRIHIPRVSQRGAMSKAFVIEQLTLQKGKGGKNAKGITGSNRMP